eukprot:29586-Pelagococcus_subviridis.AAC.12
MTTASRSRRFASSKPAMEPNGTFGFPVKMSLVTALARSFNSATPKSGGGGSSAAPSPRELVALALANVFVDDDVMDKPASPSPLTAAPSAFASSPPFAATPTRGRRPRCWCFGGGGGAAAARSARACSCGARLPETDGVGGASSSLPDHRVTSAGYSPRAETWWFSTSSNTRSSETSLAASYLSRRTCAFRVRSCGTAVRARTEGGGTVRPAGGGSDARREMPSLVRGPRAGDEVTVHPETRRRARTLARFSSASFTSVATCADLSAAMASRRSPAEVSPTKDAQLGLQIHRLHLHPHRLALQVHLPDANLPDAVLAPVRPRVHHQPVRVLRLVVEPPPDQLGRVIAQPAATQRRVRDAIYSRLVRVKVVVHRPERHRDRPVRVDLPRDARPVPGRARHGAGRRVRLLERLAVVARGGTRRRLRLRVLARVLARLELIPEARLPLVGLLGLLRRRGRRRGGGRGRPVVPAVRLAFAFPRDRRRRVIRVVRVGIRIHLALRLFERHAKRPRLVQRRADAAAAAAVLPRVPVVHRARQRELRAHPSSLRAVRLHAQPVVHHLRRRHGPARAALALVAHAADERRARGERDARVEVAREADGGRVERAAHRVDLGSQLVRGEVRVRADAPALGRRVPRLRIPSVGSAPSRSARVGRAERGAARERRERRVARRRGRSPQRAERGDARCRRRGRRRGRTRRDEDDRDDARRDDARRDERERARRRDVDRRPPRSGPPPVRRRVRARWRAPRKKRRGGRARGRAARGDERRIHRPPARWWTSARRGVTRSARALPSA